MYPENNLDAEVSGLIGIIFIIFLLVILAKLISFFIWFGRELRHLNVEVKRTVGLEKRRWLRKRRRLWLSLIPFVKY